MGLSATIGDDGELKREQLTELLGDVVHTYGVEDARRDGIIPEFDWTVHLTPPIPTNGKNGMRRQSRSPTNSSTFGGRQQPSGFSDRFLFRLPNSKTSGTSFAHEAASMVFDDEEIPDEWSNLQATIHSRT